MDRFPAEFADLLTPRGRRVLNGGAPECGALADPTRFFVALRGVVEPAQARAARALLERAMAPALVTLSRPIPPESISNQTRNYQERLIKTARARTAYLARRTSRAWQAAERIGLIAMTASESYRGFAEALAGRKLDPKLGRQVLRYGPGDYAGPHTDHHPEEARAKDGYIDMHLSFGHAGVAHQYLVYARDGHFSELADVNTAGGITVYRLPFWHYTTPLVARPGRDDACRWVVLGTFLYV